MNTKPKSKCKMCGKKHNRAKLDVLSAEYIPELFCSDFCQNASILAMLPTDQKEFAYIKCNPAAAGFKQQQIIMVQGGPVIVEHVFADGIEIGRKMEQPTTQGA